MSAVVSEQPDTLGGLPQRSPIVGVLGGMGPAATADFFTKLVQATPAAKDQEHLRTLVWSDATVPDRTAAILSDGPSPLPHLREGLRLLESAGATVIAMPCNTAHAYLPELRRESSVPVLSMVDATVRHLRRSAPAVSRVGLLATTGTLVAGLYQETLREHGLDAVVPAPLLQQRCVMRAVRLVKAGRLEAAGQSLEPAVRNITEAGAQIVVAACTELPLVLGGRAGSLPVFDSTLALAREVVTLLLRRPQNEHMKEAL
ncbi:cysteate racemase [Streptomyces achromogenes]|uniref:aspartate/glutamate racemase family protein n=1 Tax=Streptomyces achromogenes TaxID=67255 RepID=UPI0007C44319|nr:amino acid racemase [Streptomyces achromogenes]